MIRFDHTVCGDLDRALGKEWLETNGLGGFASSTIVGLNTRRYHGLLIAALHPPAGRAVLLSKIEETVVIEGGRVELSANRYPGTVHPRGFAYLREFRLDPFPTFVYDVDGVVVEKRVFLVHGEETVVVEYELTAESRRPADLRLELQPLLAFRDYHSLAHANDAIDRSVEQAPGRASIRPYADLPALHFTHDGEVLDAPGAWYYRFEYEVERERGLDFEEDLYQPFTLGCDLGARGGSTVIVSLGERRTSEAPALRKREVERRQAVADRAGSDDPVLRQLALAADQFLVKRGELTSVIAGYPWFADWGRDTMIALPGLTLALGLHETAREILLAFVRHVDQGMLPNRFPDAGETPEYNTVDATLWFFEAVAALLDATEDYDFVHDRLYPALCDIVDWHVRGTRYGIRVDADGLLLAGELGVQLTWMDAKVGDWVVTPRAGKAVEIQALWYNALRILESLAGRFGDEERCAALAELGNRARTSFNELFWNEERGCLFDVIERDGADPAIRPNQVFAVSLRYPILRPERAPSVLRVIERDLLTPVGLRTLAPSEPAYRSRYEGGVAARDGSYHQGTVWPWLLGPYIEATRKTRGCATAEADSPPDGLRSHLCEACVGQISEIFDADAPQRARGCFAQAWSVAEALRLSRTTRNP